VGPVLKYEDTKMGLGCAEGEFDPHKGSGAVME